MSKLFRKLGNKVGLIIFGMVLALMISEGVVRLFELAPDPDRFLMFSSPTFQSDETGAVRYIPNSTIRTVALYEGRIAYDVQFDTNDLGFVDHRNYGNKHDTSKKHYAFVGDSFTAGFHGGTPWVPTLRDDIQKQRDDIEIYNLGVSGTGFGHFYALLKSTQPQMMMTDIVILAISNDFDRRQWYPLTNEKEIRFCRIDIAVAACNQHGYGAAIIRQTDSVNDLLRLARNMEKSGERYEGNTTGIKKMLLYSQLWTFVDRTFFDNRADPRRVKNSLEILQQIKETFSDLSIHFIHLPQAHEVRAGAYSLDLSTEIENMGIIYFPALTACVWSETFYHSIDPHPNQDGYNHIAQCVSKYLFSH